MSIYLIIGGIIILLVALVFIFAVIIKDNLTDEDLNGTAGNTLIDNVTGDYIFDDYDAV